MKNLGYRLLKLWIKTGLYLYYGRIKISGLENVPKHKPVLFLPNHQAALMDVLLIVTDCRRKPYFLTRSDVFGNPALNSFFAFLRMLPIYRIRDGRDALRKNKAVFDQCARLFSEKQALVMFPEGNHDLKRRVRPLSKGFTRILFNTMEKTPEIDIHVVPVGMNYLKNVGFPDKVALYYGKSIRVAELYEPSSQKNSVDKIKKAVADQLRQLTTHIGGEYDYQNAIRKLNASKVDYLNPSETNRVLKSIKKSGGHLDDRGLKAALITASSEAPSEYPRASSEASPKETTFQTVVRTFFKAVFTFLNLPVIAIWRLWVRPNVWEPEFTATLRFGYALMVYPLYYLSLFLIAGAIYDYLAALVIVVSIFILHQIFVRWS